MLKRKVLKEQPASRPENTFEATALLLQGGGALGSYQAGVYEALAEANVLPDWVAGISIGAINGAIIAGNKPEDRVAHLKGFWEQITALPSWQFALSDGVVEKAGNAIESFWHQVNASVAVMAGGPGFFTPRLVPPFLSLEGTPAATSFYHTDALRNTLNTFIDFDILNSGSVRYSTSAVNVHSGNYTIFDTAKEKIRPEHIMASGALPPALPAIEIEGRYYWDGGLISNTPLQWVMEGPPNDTLIFQVDLWPAQGDFPNNMAEVATRQKEIQYSSRTRAITNRFEYVQQLRHAYARLHENLPKELKDTEEAKLLSNFGRFSQYNIVHLIYHAKNYEGFSKDFEFSRSTMEEHWKAGYNDTRHSLHHPEIFRCPKHGGLAMFDFSKD